MKDKVEIQDIARYFKSKEALIGAGIGLVAGILVMEGSLQAHMQNLKWSQIQAFRMQNLLVEGLSPLAGWFLGKAIGYYRRDGL